MSTPFSDSRHRRLNPRSREWVLISPHRMKQPWQGQVEKLPAENRPACDPTCYLCPGNERASGAKIPQYLSTNVFINDFAAILPDNSPAENATHPLLQVRSVIGTSRVICFSQRHGLTLSQIEPSAIRRVADSWAEQLFELGRTYRWVQIFENKGSVMDCSNPHPLGQIWASDSLPNEPASEDEQQRR